MHGVVSNRRGIKVGGRGRGGRVVISGLYSSRGA